jgi:glutathione peroxidase-family protein
MLTIWFMKPYPFFTTLLVMQTLALSAGSIHDLSVKDIDGKAAPLKAYQGKVLLIVNVASRCGFTPQSELTEAIEAALAAKS